MKIENKDPRIFPNVKVFAGDKFLPPADVAYRNLTWELDVKPDLLSGVAKWRNQLGTIESWGPHFRISFEMIIKSFSTKGHPGPMTNILEFYNHKYRRPKYFGILSVSLETKAFFLQFSNHVNGNGKYSYVYRKPELNKWYKIIIEQKPINGKVRIVA